MSYGKKDEDADLGLVKVDRTQVFQEGEHTSIASTPPTTQLNGGQHDYSTVPRFSREDVASS